MNPTKLTLTKKVSLFLALVAVFAMEFLFALALGYSVLQYLSAVMDLAQLPAAPETPAPPS